MAQHSGEFRRFTDLVDRLLDVPRTTLDERIRRHKELAAANPNKRGPKPKAVKPSASRRASEKP